MPTSYKHDKILKEFLIELENKGFRCFDLERKCPDGIAIKDNKIYAIEVLGRRHRKGKGWKKKYTMRAKKSIYHMFDDILIKDFRYPLRKEGGHTV